MTPCRIMRLMLAWSVRLQHQLTLAAVEHMYRDIDLQPDPAPALTLTGREADR